MHGVSAKDRVEPDEIDLPVDGNISSNPRYIKGVKKKPNGSQFSL